MYYPLNMPQVCTFSVSLYSHHCRASLNLRISLLTGHWDSGMEGIHSLFQPLHGRILKTTDLTLPLISCLNPDNDLLFIKIP